MTRIAALPMYDFPELRDAHDQLWAALARRLIDAGIADVPLHLSRDLEHRDTWRHSGLLFGQACEYPLAKSFAGSLQLVATPCYSVTGCDGSSYRSAIVVRAEESARTLQAFRGRRCVVNEPDSNSGMNLLRAAVAPVAYGSRFFQSVVFSGSHRCSLELVAAKAADITAVDCISFAHLQRFQPSLASQVKVLDWTAASPCLPFVTAQRTSAATLQALRDALSEIFSDRELVGARQKLHLEGVNLQPDVTLARVLRLEGMANRSRYPVLL